MPIDRFQTSVAVRAKIVQDVRPEPAAPRQSVSKLAIRESLRDQIRFALPPRSRLQELVIPRPLPDALRQNQAETLDAGDRMGNFEIQRLMSAFNQAETLSSNVQKKADDTANAQAQRIG